MHGCGIEPPQSESIKIPKTLALPYEVRVGHSATLTHRFHLCKTCLFESIDCSGQEGKRGAHDRHYARSDEDIGVGDLDTGHLYKRRDARHDQACRDEVLRLLLATVYGDTWVASASSNLPRSSKFVQILGNTLMPFGRLFISRSVC